MVPDRLAATMGDDELTFAQLDGAHQPGGAGVRRPRGSARGDRVAWWGETSLAAMPIFGALAKLGAAFMPVNARLGVDEAEAGDRLRPARRSRSSTRPTRARRSTSVRQAALFAEAASRLEPATCVDPALDERDPHVIFFTSGSTGRSKGVVLSHRTSYLRSFPNLITDWTGGTVCMFPLFHMSGWSMALNAWQMRLPGAPRRRPTRARC